MFQPGQSFGKFYLLQVLGEGGSSRIFKALQQPISRIVALKIPSFNDGGNILTPDEFLSEATLMARLDHPNVVRIHDFGVQEDKAFICMEYVEGNNLQELVAARHPLSSASVLSIACQTLEGLLYSHSQEVLHLDLSPANVLISRQGVVKLTDFGMAGKQPLPDKRGRAPGTVVGTPGFLSPEHVGGRTCTARSDLFSFASLLYFVCLGDFLFDPGDANQNIADAFARIARARSQPPEDKLKRLPAPLASLARKALDGSDPEGLLSEARALWAKAEGETRPDAALKRELNAGEEDIDAPGGDGSEAALRARYQRLREEGRHREAVALLEKALRRRPDHPLLQELIAAPPVKVKSDLVTVEVGMPAAPAKAPGRKAAPLWLGLGGALLGIAALGAFAVNARLHRDPAAAPVAATAPIPSPATATPQAPDPAPAPPREETPVAAAVPSTPAIPSAPVPEKPRTARARKVATPPAGDVAAPAAAVATHAPALGIAGPAFTRVVLNDSAEFFSPSPEQGWNMPAGLARLTLKRPDSKESISSSLFMSPDTFYLIRLEDDGGFSIARRPR